MFLLKYPQTQEIVINIEYLIQSQQNLFQLLQRVDLNSIITEFSEGGCSDKKPISIPVKDYDIQGKKTLVLDLDETLVTSSVLEFSTADLKIKVNLTNGNSKNVWVKFRPGVYNFLNELSEFYEIIIFTASIKEYANVVIDFLDRESLVNLRIFRENCSQDSQGNLYKDLFRLNRPIQDIIIIDNQACQFIKNPENGIKIKDFKIDNDQDIELFNLIPFLKFMSRVKDVRNVSAYMNDFYSGNQIIYIDVNDMECTYQRGIVVEEERLETEKTESKIDPMDLQFREDPESSQLGQTIKLDSRDYKKKNDNVSMMNHFEDDIDTAMQIQQNMNNKSRTSSNNNAVYQNSPQKPPKKEKESISEKKQSYKYTQKNAKTVFNFTTFKQSLYNKLGSLDPEKENIELNIQTNNELHPSLVPINSSLNETSEDPSLHYFNKSGLIKQQSQNSDHQENFITRPKRITRPHQRRCVSQAIQFVEVHLKDEHFNSPSAKDI